MIFDSIRNPLRLLAAITFGVLVGRCGLFPGAAEAAEIFVEAESFADHGGWKLDTQFIQQMGSPYLLAHGLGNSVDDARTTIEVPQAGQYRVWVRTIDWVAKFGATPSPGRFSITIGENELPTEFGTGPAAWGWIDGGTTDLTAGKTELKLHDLTGFDGRVDCIYLTTDLQSTPPPVDDVLSPWRRQRLGLDDQPRTKGGYDLVVVGGGYAGMGAAISAARMGCRVALIQDRGVLGGNGSSEVRVWAMGNIRRGKFPRIGEIVEEFSDSATKSPGRADEFGDEVKEQIVRDEPNIDLMLNTHAYAVDMDPTNPNEIAAVRVLDVRTGEDLRVAGDRFSDCTGHGWIGIWAAADSDMAPDGRMGMSNMWTWDETGTPTGFPETPWALNLMMKDFPYPRDHHGQWFWESGFDKDAIGDAEAIRDHNLRAVYGAFNAMKNRDGADQHRDAVLTWVAYVGGPRESNRLLGDVILNQDDVVAKREFPDGCVPSTWSIDLHYPKQQYVDASPDNPFISVAVHDRRVDKSYGYPVPYRCFYSRNIENLFMAGRNISVTHEALGTTRVMKTCGMMGEVVGKAASLCTLHGCTPRDVYQDHLPELLELLRLPGVARRSTVTGDLVIRNPMASAGPKGPMPGLDPLTLPGFVIDDSNATMVGPWQGGGGLKGYVGWEYQYADERQEASATFSFTPESAGRYRLDVYSLPHENRATKTPVEVSINDHLVGSVRIDQRTAVPNNRVDGGIYNLPAGRPVNVTVSTRDAGGVVHVDAIGWVPVDQETIRPDSGENEGPRR